MINDIKKIMRSQTDEAESDIGMSDNSEQDPADLLAPYFTDSDEEKYNHHEKRFFKGLINRFNACASKLDNSIKPYAILTSRRQKVKFILKKLKKADIRIDDSFEGKMPGKNGSRFNHWIVRHAKYKRTANGKIESFNFYEIYSEDEIKSLLIANDKKVFDNCLVKDGFTESEIKLFKDQLKISNQHFACHIESKSFDFDWRDCVAQNTECGFPVPVNADITFSAEIIHLAFSIIGYSTLAAIYHTYVTENEELRSYKLMPLNIVVSESTYPKIKKLLHSCFVRADDHRDIAKLPEYNVNDIRSADEVFADGRCVIIDNFNKSNNEKLLDILIEYVDYYKERNRKVLFPYTCFPVVISSEPIEQYFYNVNALLLDIPDDSSLYKDIADIYSNAMNQIYNIDNTTLMKKSIRNGATKYFDYDVNNQTSPVLEQAYTATYLAIGCLTALSLMPCKNENRKLSFKKTWQDIEVVFKDAIFGTENDVVYNELVNLVNHINSLISEAEASAFNKPDTLSYADKVIFYTTNREYVCLSDALITELLQTFKVGAHNEDSFADVCSKYGLLHDGKEKNGRTKVNHIEYTNENGGITKSYKFIALEVNKQDGLIVMPKTISESD